MHEGVTNMGCWDGPRHWQLGAEAPPNTERLYFAAQIMIDGWED